MAKSYYRKTMESRNQCRHLKIDISKGGSYIMDMKIVKPYNNY